MKLAVQLNENESPKKLSSITVAEAIYNLVGDLNSGRDLYSPVISLEAIIEILAQQVIADREMEKFLNDNAPCETTLN